MKEQNKFSTKHIVLNSSSDIPRNFKTLRKVIIRILELNR